jgi:hypothetical protein
MLPCTKTAGYPNILPLDARIIGQAFGEEVDQALRRLAPSHGEPLSRT